MFQSPLYRGLLVHPLRRCRLDGATDISVPPSSGSLVHRIRKPRGVPGHVISVPSSSGVTRSLESRSNAASNSTFQPPLHRGSLVHAEGFEPSPRPRSYFSPLLHRGSLVHLTTRLTRSPRGSRFSPLFIGGHSFTNDTTRTEIFGHLISVPSSSGITRSPRGPSWIAVMSSPFQSPLHRGSLVHLRPRHSQPAGVESISVPSSSGVTRSPLGTYNSKTAGLEHFSPLFIGGHSFTLPLDAVGAVLADISVPSSSGVTRSLLPLVLDGAVARISVPSSSEVTRSPRSPAGLVARLAHFSPLFIGGHSFTRSRRGQTRGVESISVPSSSGVTRSLWPTVNQVLAWL